MVNSSLALRVFSPEVQGIWTIEKSDQTSGRAYNGTVQISPFGQVYQVAWLLESGNNTGIAFYLDQYLCGGWSYDPNCRMSVYQILPDQSLEGCWTSPTVGGAIGRETFTPDLKSATDLDGLYESLVPAPIAANQLGTNPTLQAQISSVSVRRSGDLYHLRHSRTPMLSGLGLRVGDRLVVTWGQGRGFGVFYYNVKAGEAEGGWASPQSNQLTPEIWAKLG